MDLAELREELLEEALEMLENKYKTHKKFAKMHFAHILTTNGKIESITQYMPTMYSTEEAIAMAKAMEAYVLGNAK